MRISRFASLITFGALLAIGPAAAQEAGDPPGRPYEWNPDSMVGDTTLHLGNHRAVIRVTDDADAVWVHLEWRRRDWNPAGQDVVIMDPRTGAPVRNVARVHLTRAAADLVFQPSSGPGDYHIYYRPFAGNIESPYPTISYPAPMIPADSGWLARHDLGSASVGLDREHFPQAELVGFQAVNEFNSFDPMELIATPAELQVLLERHADARYLVFPEDRRHPIRMTRDLPRRWIEQGAGGPFEGGAYRGEFYVFQLGIYAARDSLSDVRVGFTDLRPTAGGVAIPSSAFRCFNLGGVDWQGRRFTRQVSVDSGLVQSLWCGVQLPVSARPGHYAAIVTVEPAGLAATPIELRLTIGADTIPNAGDDEPWRLSRLRWLDSRLASDDSIVEPYAPVTLNGTTVGILGRDFTLGSNGLPTSIRSYFDIEMTRIGDRPRELLAAPIRLVAEDSGGRLLTWEPEGLEFGYRAEGAVEWTARNAAGPLAMELRGRAEFDGYVRFTVAIRAVEEADLNDVRLEIPIAEGVARYMMGMGRRGGFRPDSFDWQWDVTRNHDAAWIGDVNAGLQFSLRDDEYRRPLNTNFYQLQPLVMPESWNNGGRGGCRFRERGDAFLATCYSGARTMQAGEVQRYDFILLLTPFHTLDTQAQWSDRYFHAYAPLDSIAELGANVINVHHATPINPWINYPFLTPDTMKAYVDAAHARGMRVKLYYTVRELTNHAPELFALRSLGHEIFSPGKGGGAPWLQEHVADDYIAGWHVNRIKDAALVNSGVSRWHNFYVEGLHWLVENMEIDGLYIDDVAFDRSIMKRVRKVLDRSRPDALIDLHSANQYNERDGFVNSANLYLEHFPYIDRLWFGEYFDYTADPDYWLVEVSGIPYGLMGEMLQDGGNPWRGMVFGMTARLPWSGDPRPLWHLWDEFGIQQSRMIGWWVPKNPIRTGRSDVLATAFVRDGRTMVALASWAPDTVAVSLDIDWDALGLDGERATITAPAVRDFQDTAAFAVGQPIPVPPGQGWLLVIRQPRER